MLGLYTAIFFGCSLNCFGTFVANVEQSSKEFRILIHFDTLKPATFPNYLYKVSKSTCKVAYQVR